MTGHSQIGFAPALLAAALTLALAPPATAQNPEPPPLSLVLSRLEANYNEYVRSVPNLFCDERVRSAYGPVAALVKPIQTLTESTFRLQRAAGPDHKPILKEFRDVKTIDGKPVITETVGGPSILSGVFGSALGLVSTAETPCMRYKLHPHLSGSRNGTLRIVVDFAALSKHERNPDCGTRDSGGRAFIDPDTLRLRRIEVKTPGFEILPNVLGEWDWSANYDAVLFDGKPFWLPTTIDSTAVAYGPSAMAWTFTAHYTGCHQLAVKSRILPGLTTEPTPP